MKKSELSTIFLTFIFVILLGLVAWKISKPKPQPIKTKEVVVMKLQEIENHTDKRGQTHIIDLRVEDTTNG